MFILLFIVVLMQTIKFKYKSDEDAQDLDLVITTRFTIQPHSSVSIGIYFNCLSLLNLFMSFLSLKQNAVMYYQKR